MTRKNIIALLAVIALFAGTVQAHPPWPIQYGPKEGPSIEVRMLVVRWADIYVDGTILIEQVNPTDFVGCINVTVCSNFDFLKVIGKVIPMEISQGVSGVGAGSWEIRMTSALAASASGGLSAASPQVWQTDETYIVFGTNSVVYGSLMPLQICVAARNVDPQSQLYTVGLKIPVATVELTMLPDVPVDGWSYDP